MASAEIYQCFVELQSFHATACHFPNDIDSLERRLRHLEDHSSIIGTFSLLMSNVQQNIAERTLCILLEEIYESLRQLSAEIALRVKAIEAADAAHSASQRGGRR